MDDHVAGWAFLPDDGSRMHRTDPAGRGRTLCDRELDPRTPVVRAPRRAFTICVKCRAAGAQYPIPQPGQPTDRATVAAADAAPLRPRIRVVEGRSLGWVQLPKPPQILHRPDPYLPDRVLCGLVLPGRTPIHQTPPTQWPPCPECQQRADAEAKAGAEAKRDHHRGGRPDHPAGGPPQAAPKPAVSARVRRLLAAGPVLGDGPTGTAGTWQLPVGWVRLDSRSSWHRPHPERPDQVMCGLALPAGVAVLRRRVGTRRACPDCEAVRAAALTEQRARDRTTRQKRSARATPRPPRPRPVRGGLPTLGRNR